MKILELLLLVLICQDPTHQATRRNACENKVKVKLLKTLLPDDTVFNHSTVQQPLKESSVSPISSRICGTGGLKTLPNYSDLRMQRHITYQSF